MTADEIALKAKLYNLFVNLGFGAAYICDDTVILYDILKLCEIFDIFVSYFKNFTISAPYQTQSSLQVSLIQPS